MALQLCYNFDTIALSILFYIVGKGQAKMTSSTSTDDSHSRIPISNSLSSQSSSKNSTKDIICSPCPSIKVVEVAIKTGHFGTHFLVSLCILAFIISGMVWLSATYEPPAQTNLPPSQSDPPSKSSREKRDRIRFSEEIVHHEPPETN